MKLVRSVTAGVVTATTVSLLVTVVGAGVKFG